MDKKPLFDIPIPVIILSGPFSSGKTIFGLSICPEETGLFDMEESAASYAAQFGIKQRISAGQEMLKLFPDSYKPIDLYLWWLKRMRAIKPGEFRVLMIDTVSGIEDGMADWVRANPQHFGATRQQYDKMSGLLWAHMKSLWEQLINEMSAKAEVVVLVVHMKNEWAGSSPTGKRIPKGKETLDQMGSLYLILDRTPDKTTAKIPDKPRARVRKHRLAVRKFNPESGDYEPVPILPPHLEIATPGQIRKYIAQGGVDYKKLTAAEKLGPEEKLSDDDKLQLENSIALAKAEAAKAELSRAELIRENNRLFAEQQRAAAAAAEQELKTESTAHLPPIPAAAVEPTIDVVKPAAPPPITNGQLMRLVAAKKALLAAGWSEEQYQAELKSRGVKTAREMDSIVGESFVRSLEEKAAGAGGGSAQATKSS